MIRHRKDNIILWSIGHKMIKNISFVTYKS